MKRAMNLLALVLFLVATPPAQAQTAAPKEAAQFDFLIGQWEIELSPKVNGMAAMVHGRPRLQGSWKAWRAFDGYGVDDELRVFDGSGNPVTLSHAQRIYDGKTQRWLISSLDVYGARFSAASAQWQNGEMRLNGTGSTNEGKPLLTRSRFFEITPERFRVQQDRSLDNGASWDEAVLTISAKRIAAKAPR